MTAASVRRPGAEPQPHGRWSLLAPSAGAVVAALLLARRGNSIGALVALGVAGALAQLGVLVPRLVRGLTHSIAVVAHALASALGAVLLTAIDVALFWPAALLLRLLASNPVRPRLPRGRHTTWWVASPSVRPDRPYGDERGRQQEAWRTASRARRSVHRTAGWARVGLVVSVPVVLLGLAYVDRRATTTSSEAVYSPIQAPAMAAQPDARSMLQEQAAAWGTIHYVPGREYALGDFRSRSTNQIGMVRASYEPMVATGDPPAEVWFFGGSTLYGSGQRDDHTIPSEVARFAAADGKPMRVRNYGVPGYVASQEVLALQEALASGERPDVVVFYDGFNDFFSGMSRPLIPVPVGQPTNGFSADFEALITGRRDSYNPTTPGATRSSQRLASLEERYDGVIEQHRTALEQARVLADQYGFKLVSYWQPSAFSRDLVPGELKALRDIGWDDFQMANWRAELAAVRTRLPAGTIDLSDALASEQRPVYTDVVHTNELGAADIARALYVTLAPEIAGPPPGTAATAPDRPS